MAKNASQNASDLCFKNWMFKIFLRGACPRTTLDGKYPSDLFHPWPVFMPGLHLYVTPPP